jgi:hypothetical protein
MNYMFFESSRILEKQEKYEKIRAYDFIESLEKIDMPLDTMIATLDLYLKDVDSEYKRIIIHKAKSILEARKEEHETVVISNPSPII